MHPRLHHRACDLPQCSVVIVTPLDGDDAQPLCSAVVGTGVAVLRCSRTRREALLPWLTRASIRPLDDSPEAWHARAFVLCACDLDTRWCTTSVGLYLAYHDWCSRQCLLALEPDEFLDAMAKAGLGITTTTAPDGAIAWHGVVPVHALPTAPA